MIYEIRTYTLKPGAVAEYEARFAEGYPVREKYSKLGGFWRTDIGPLNQVIHIWPYESLQHRAQVRAAAAKDPSGKWPPKGSEFLVSQESDILVPVRTMPPWGEPHQWGGLYELRVYTYPPGAQAEIAEKFGAALPARAELYPVAGIWTSELGHLNRLYQLFPFKDWAHREELRTVYRSRGLWPPQTTARPHTQLVRHMLPAAFSPLH